MNLSNFKIGRVSFPEFLWAWTPLIFFVIAIVAANFLLGAIINEEKGFNPFSPEIKILKTVSGDRIGTFAELTGRIFWSISVLFFFLSIASIYIVMLWNVFSALDRSISKVVMVVLIIILSAVGASNLVNFDDTFGFNVPLLGNSIYKVSSAFHIVDSIQSLSVATLFSLSVVLSILSWHTSAEVFPKNEVKTGKEVTRDIYCITRTKRRVQALLYMGAIVLVAGTIQTTALYTWAISMIDNSSAMTNTGTTVVKYFANLEDVPIVLSSLNGAFYSILLFTVFTPSLLHLRLLSLKLACLVCNEKSIQEQESWLLENSLIGSGLQQVISILLMLAPAMAGGPLSMLLDIAV